MRYRCYACPKPAFGRHHEFEADKPECPKCGAGEPAVVDLVDVHLLIQDPRGPIVGQHGRRWRVGCMPRREHLAAHEHDTFSASDHAAAVTCPSCKGVREYQDQVKAFTAARAGFRFDDSGCCG